MIGGITLDILHAVILVPVTGLLLATVILLTEIVASFAGSSRSRNGASRPAGSYVVLVPAHDEVGTIEPTLAALSEQVDSHGRILVIADNCTDQTATVSEAAGADVISRCDPARLGKGYALDFGLRHLHGNPPDVIVIMDADCIPAPGAIQALVKRSQQLGQPVQARYELEPPAADAGTLARVGSFAWRVKNIVRPTGLANLNLPCLLMGTGMAIPWSCISEGQLNTGHLVEDMVLGLEVASAGNAPRFLPDALVISRLPASVEGQVTQRTRWESGHLSVIATVLPRLFVRAVTTLDTRLLALVLHTAVPPLAFLALLLAGATAITALTTHAGGPHLALYTILAADLMMLAAVVIAWCKVGMDLLSFSEVVMLPAYIIAKLPLYARALSRKKIPWIRSRRT